MMQALRQAAIPAYLFLCIVLGGSARGHWGNLLLQLGAIAILAWAALSRRPGPFGRPAKQLAWLVAAAVALVAAQLLPLPPALWTVFRGRSAIAEGYRLLGQPLPWLPVSLAPYATISTALWLLPPIAVLAGIVRLGAFKASWLAMALGTATFLAVMLGALQVSGGESVHSPWYLYRVTNFGQATGFFANSNHMATLLVATVPFLVALGGSPRWREKRLQSSAGKLALVAGGMLILALGIALNGSLAGVGLGIPVIAASLLIPVRLSRSWLRWVGAAIVVLGAGSIALVATSPVQVGLAAAGAEQSVTTRSTMFATTLDAARDFAPLGSGLGSFVDVYHQYEDPAVVDPTYVNHAHSDYLELALELGLPGVLLIALFLLWWAARLVAIWRSPTIDAYARAATIASAAMLVHSAVDYPLRTSALAALFATCIALILRPRRGIVVEPAADGQDARHLSIG